MTLRLRRAAACAFLIAAAAVLRTVWGLWFYQSLRPLATYNALFVPVFAVFGLLCLVMSALFRQAAEGGYPRAWHFLGLSYDQGIRNSLYYAEELHIAEAVDKSIVVTDRATLFNLIIGLDGYTISSGILSEDLNGSQITSIPLESPEHMELGYVKRADRPLSSVAERYLQLLQEYVNEYQREAGE